MCQHGIVLILVSTFCYGLGLPVRDNTNQTQISFSNELLNLANSCENLFLAEIIKSRIDYCNILEQFHSKKDYECLMFYEINKQLCSSFGRTEIDLKGSYASKMNVTQNILTICDDAKTWKSASLYKPVLDKLFNSRILCLQVCTIDEMVSEDSNFFCKYYKWGSGMISSLTSPITQPSSIIAPTNSEIKPEVKSEASVTTNNAVNPQNSNVEPHSKEKNQSEQTTKSETALKQDVHKDADLNEPSKATSALQKPETKENNNDKSAPISSKSELENPLEQPSLKSDLEKENQGKPVIENPKPKQSLDLDDDPDNELGNDLEPDDEPLLDQDTMDSEDMNADPKLDVEKSKENANIIKSPITSFNVDSVQREMVYPNSIQDTFVEEDDHFFPFFLTTIVLVVLLYILYHNKSKVTKVILGLIVEGRQSNRRRNSRGHAYRRLDTLEQAMSTNSTAPPSKIIY